jgi:glyoxylase-like metal-dependent hydrolase (beta-lactamase superfamily II)
MTADVIKVGPLGPFANNAYIIADRATKRAIFIDAPLESDGAIERAAGYDVQMVIVTHRHGDHWANIDLVREQLGAPVWCHDADRTPYAAKVFDTVADGDEIPIGETRVRIIHTPGHTPGSICIFVPSADGGPVLISGATLFPGGPGRSDSNEALQEMIASITTKLFVLPDETRVLPGHGDDTTIAAARAEYDVFASKDHPADLKGDVLWLES